MKEFIQFLGCGDAFSSGGRFHTCFYVGAPDYNFLIDFGATSLVALKRHKVPEVNVILITHFHGDHFGGLPYYFLHEKFVSQRQKPLSIIGPSGLENKVAALMELLYPGAGLDQLGFEIEFREYSAGKELLAGPLQIQAYPVIHSKGVNPHALRIGFNQRTIAYSGDTEWTDTLIEVAKNADVFICECNFFNTEAPNHLSHRALLAHQHELKAKRMILNHMSDEMLDNLSDVQFEVAEDGKIVEL